MRSDDKRHDKQHDTHDARPRVHPALDLWTDREPPRDMVQDTLTALANERRRRPARRRFWVVPGLALAASLMLVAGLAVKMRQPEAPRAYEAHTTSLSAKTDGAYLDTTPLRREAQEDFSDHAASGPMVGEDDGRASRDVRGRAMSQPPSVAAEARVDAMAAPQAAAPQVARQRSSMLDAAAEADEVIAGARTSLRPIPPAARALDAFDPAQRPLEPHSDVMDAVRLQLELSAMGATTAQAMLLEQGLRSAVADAPHAATEEPR